MGDVDNRTLGDCVRDARTAKDVGLREVAKRLGVAPSYLSDIENDRRTPSEDVLRALSRELALDFDELMARAGRVGEQAERYLRRVPTAGVLFRRISERNLSPEEVGRLLQEVDRLDKGT
jgi:transcriptional regulator with XRE-family HTH domain